jgi:hypothetical protein
MHSRRPANTDAQTANASRAQSAKNQAEEPARGNTIVVEGRTLWKDGAPSAGAIVLGREDGIPRCQTRSDADGKFRLVCERVDRIDVVALGLEDPSSPPQVMPINSLPFSMVQGPPYRPRPQPWQGVVIEVPRSDSISGQVLEPDGRPAVGATVLWGRERDTLVGVDPSILDTWKDVTDAQGRFNVRGLKAGVIGTLKAISPTHTSMRLHGIRSGSTGVVMRFTRGATIVGRIDAPGKAIPRRFTVELIGVFQHSEVWQRMEWRRVINLGRVPGKEPPRPPLVAARRTVDTTTGEFTITGVGAGLYDMEVRTDDGRVGCLEDIEIVEGSEPIPLVVEIGKSSLQGRVVDADTGRPLGGVELRLGTPPGNPRVKTDRNGRFALGFGVPGSSILVDVQWAPFPWCVEEFLVRPSAAKQNDVGDLQLLKVPMRFGGIDIQLLPSLEGPVVSGGAAAAAGLAKGDRLVSISGRSVVSLGPVATSALIQARCAHGCDIEVLKPLAASITRMHFKPDLNSR